MFLLGIYTNLCISSCVCITLKQSFTKPYVHVFMTRYTNVCILLEPKPHMEIIWTTKCTQYVAHKKQSQLTIGFLFISRVMKGQTAGLKLHGIISFTKIPSALEQPAQVTVKQYVGSRNSSNTLDAIRCSHIQFKVRSYILHSTKMATCFLDVRSTKESMEDKKHMSSRSASQHRSIRSLQSLRIILTKPLQSHHYPPLIQHLLFTLVLLHPCALKGDKYGFKT